MEASKRKIVFATNNRHKLDEIRRILGDSIEVLSLGDIGCTEELPETADTIAGNAELKARYVAENYGVECFADDTGLEVKALGGAPGVHTARYASESGHDSGANMRKLLSELQGASDRTARFVTFIAHACPGGAVALFEGICNGSIATHPSGEQGFGYDPVFLPDDARGLTFAQMDADTKNAISHRGRASRLFAAKLLETKQ